MRMDTITLDGANALTREAEDALKAVCEKHGLIVDVSPGTYTDTNLSFKVNVAVKTESGAPADFERTARVLHLPANCYGAEFMVRGKTYTITGINLRRRKYPVSATHDGKPYKFTASSIRASLDLIDLEFVNPRVSS